MKPLKITLLAGEQKETEVYWTFWEGYSSANHTVTGLVWPRSEQMIVRLCRWSVAMLRALLQIHIEHIEHTRRIPPNVWSFLYSQVFLGFYKMAVAQKTGIPKWLALVSGNVDHHLRSQPLRSFNFEHPNHFKRTPRVGHLKHLGTFRSLPARIAWEVYLPSPGGSR